MTRELAYANYLSLCHGHDAQLVKEAVLKRFITPDKAILYELAKRNVMSVPYRVATRLGPSAVVALDSGANAALNSIMHYGNVYKALLAGAGTTALKVSKPLVARTGNKAVIRFSDVIVDAVVKRRLKPKELHKLYVKLLKNRSVPARQALRRQFNIQLGYIPDGAWLRRTLKQVK